MESCKKDVGQRIRERRLELGYSMKFVAEKAELEVSNYIPYEKGRVSPSLYTISKIAKALDTTIDYLYLGSDRVISPSSDDVPRQIVDCFVFLIDAGVIIEEQNTNFLTTTYDLAIDRKFNESLQSLFENLINLDADKENYGDSYDAMVENFKKAAAKKIDKDMKKEEEEE